MIAPYNSSRTRHLAGRARSSADSLPHSYGVYSSLNEIHASGWRCTQEHTKGHFIVVLYMAELLVSSRIHRRRGAAS